MKTVARPATSLSGQLRARHAGVDRRVVLDRALDRSSGRALAHQLGRLAHLLDLGARARTRRSSRRASPRAARCRTARRSRPRRSRCRPAARRRVRVDRAVAVDEHAVGEAHEEHAGDDRDARARLDDLERRPDRLRGRVRGAGDHPVGHPERDHHRAEVGDVGDDVARQVDGHALVRAQRRVLGREALQQLRLGRVEHVRAGEVEPSRDAAPRTVGLGAEQRQLDHAPAQQRSRPPAGRAPRCPRAARCAARLRARGRSACTRTSAA